MLGYMTVKQSLHDSTFDFNAVLQVCSAFALCVDGSIRFNLLVSSYLSMLTVIFNTEWCYMPLSLWLLQYDFDVGGPKSPAAGDGSSSVDKHLWFWSTLLTGKCRTLAPSCPSRSSFIPILHSLSLMFVFRLGAICSRYFLKFWL